MENVTYCVAAGVRPPLMICYDLVIYFTEVFLRMHEATSVCAQTAQSKRKKKTTVNVVLPSSIVKPVFLGLSPTVYFSKTHLQSVCDWFLLWQGLWGFVFFMVSVCLPPVAGVPVAGGVVGGELDWGSTGSNWPASQSHIKLHKLPPIHFVAQKWTCTTLYCSWLLLPPLSFFLSKIMYKQHSF